MVAIIHKRSWRDFDWILALLAIGIVLFGTVQIRNAQPTETYWVKQLIGLSIGLVAMLAIAFTDYRRLLNLAPAFYIFGLILLVLVLFPGIGLKINGQRAWIKVMLVGGLILALPIALILLEPDVGSVLTYMPILAVVLFLSAIKLRLVVASAAIAVVLIPAAYVMGVKTGMVKGYQQERINVILDPENADRRRIGYHTWQSIITVGEGGLFGSRSSAEHSQSGLKFLPEPHTDFIYAVTAENAGFVGCVLVLLAYIILLSRLITGARRSSDRMGMLFIMAVVGGLTFQTFINMGMALGISPVIGVPLPLMSAGLASLIATFIAIGFAISVQLRRFVN